MIRIHNIFSEYHSVQFSKVELSAAYDRLDSKAVYFIERVYFG